MGGGAAYEPEANRRARLAGWTRKDPPECGRSKPAAGRAEEPGMQWITAILGLFFPRLALVLMWLFSDYLGRAFETTVWPVLGFVFMPFTTLAWALAQNEGGGVHGVWIAVVVIAALVDLGVVGKGAKDRRKHA